MEGVNPLFVASNMKGKKRFCLDLSRHVNESCQAKKFRIESIQDFIKTVNQGSWCWYYDLKSGFHHISIIQKHRKFLGFRVVIDGKARVIRFVAMPFGYKDASRILTKVMRTPICRWRVMNITSFIHIDDGLGFMRTKEEARTAAESGTASESTDCLNSSVESSVKILRRSWSSRRGSTLDEHFSAMGAMY